MSDDQLAAVTAERDRLRERIDAYEGALQEREHIEKLIEESSLGTASAESARNQTPPGLGKAIVLGAQYLARAESAEAERDRLREAVIAVHGELAFALGSKSSADIVHAVRLLRAERHRLRAVVEAARAYVEAEVDDQCPDAEYFRDGLVAALAALDKSAEATDG